MFKKSCPLSVNFPSFFSRLGFLSDYSLPSPLTAKGDQYFTGHGVAEDKSIALKYYLLAKREGEPQAFFRLSHMYKYGDGISQDVALASALKTRGIEALRAADGLLEKGSNVDQQSLDSPRVYHRSKSLSLFNTYTPCEKAPKSAERKAANLKFIDIVMKSKPDQTLSIEDRYKKAQLIGRAKEQEHVVDFAERKIKGLRKPGK